MNVFQHIAKSYKAVYFGKNWTASTLKEQLEDVTWEEATKEIYGLNTIAILVNHIHYYTRVATKVLEGGPLEGNDKLSFAHESISSAEDWEAFKNSRFSEAERFITLVENVPEEKLNTAFGNSKYGDYFRNLEGITEHAHYHLGQIVLLKKILRHNTKSSD